MADEQDKLVARVQEELEPGERVVAAVRGTYETAVAPRAGVLVATDRRLVFFGKKLMGYNLESFPYRQISSFEVRKNVTGHVIRSRPRQTT